MSAERRALLLALLQHHQELPPVDISDLSGTEKLDAIVMCCSELITDAIWIMSQCDEADAIKGIDALMTDIKANINKRPALGRPMP